MTFKRTPGVEGIKTVRLIFFILTALLEMFDKEIIIMCYIGWNKSPQVHDVAETAEMLPVLIVTFIGMNLRHRHIHSPIKHLRWSLLWIVNGWKLLPIFSKSSILDQGWRTVCVKLLEHFLWTFVIMYPLQPHCRFIQDWHQ